MTVHSPPPASPYEEPPAPTRTVLRIGLVGVGLAFLALVIGLVTGAPRRGFDPHAADGVRALLSILGLLVAGCAVSLRPGWYGGWLCAAAAALGGYGIGGPLAGSSRLMISPFQWVVNQLESAPPANGWQLAPPRDWIAGLPNSWDSVQLFFGVAFVVGLVGAVCTRLRWKTVYVLILGAVGYHFAGITSAVTSPPPTPWLTDQYWKRVARPYLQFAYLNNAYQFYSPDPGPACELWVCIEYQVPGVSPDDTQHPKDCEWVYIPRRASHLVDPLGLSFYRRLSVTENVAQYSQSTPMPLEHEKVIRRREAHKGFIPRVYGDGEQGAALERRVPNELVSNQILPSYARHLVWAYADPAKEVKGVKIYRVLHMITTLAQFRGYDVNTGRTITGMSPYNHSLYLPYFQGEFDAQGRLKDSTDPMLYWMVPILQDPARPVPASREEYRQQGGYTHFYIDYVSKHAGCRRPQE